MRHYRLAIILTMPLSACVGTEKVNVTHFECLPMIEYSQVEQAQAAKELSALPATSELAKFVTDYEKMRAADRACKASQ